MSAFLSALYILVAGKIGIQLLWQFEGFQNCKIWPLCRHCAWCSRYSITFKIMLAIRGSSAGHRLTTRDKPTQDTRKIWISWKGNFHYKNSALKFFPLQEFLGKQNNLPSYIQVKIRNFLSRNSVGIREISGFLSWTGRISVTKRFSGKLFLEIYVLV